MTTFQDIFKSSFLENVTSVSIPDILIALALAFALGMFIFLIYKKTYAGVMYSSGFGVTLLALTMITTLVILAVTSNVVLSLGMVGALSIVRFRTAIKEPLDIAFLFCLLLGIQLGITAFHLFKTENLDIQLIQLFQKIQFPPFIALKELNDDHTLSLGGRPQRLSYSQSRLSSAIPTINFCYFSFHNNSS